MKRILVICLAALLSSGCVILSTERAPEAERSIESIREVPLKQNQIYDKAIEWLAKNFVDSKQVIEVQNRETGTIIGKGVTTFINGGGLIAATIPCRFTVTIEAKDGRYRVVYDNFTGMWGQAENYPQPVVTKAHLYQVRDNIEVMDQELFNYVSAKKKDW